MQTLTLPSAEYLHEMPPMNTLLFGMLIWLTAAAVVGLWIAPRLFADREDAP